MAVKKKTTPSQVKKRPAAPTPSKPGASGDVKILQVSVEDLIGHEDNPNMMDEATFDQLVEEIREQGFDEPILVRKSKDHPGKYEIGSGHHRTKAARVLGMLKLPVIVKDWTDRELKVSLAKRNALRGNFDKVKLAKLYHDLSKGRDPVQVQRELGFTDTKKFEKIIEETRKTLNPAQRKKLDEAKEDIKSMDDLSSVLNRIFKESGSELDHGYLVFSFGGKNHHYFQIGKETEDKLQAIMKACEKSGTKYTDFIQSIVAAAALPTGTKPDTKTRTRKRKITKEA